MTRHESTAMVLALTSWGAVLPAFFHHFLPLACWLTGWVVMLATKEPKR